MAATLRVLLASKTAHDQFYLPELSGCWKLDGSPCDGHVLTDVTRYVCFILAANIKSQCRPDNQRACPPYHTDADTGMRVYRNNTAQFPYECYYLYCRAPNDNNVDSAGACDPYSNPNPQELMQLLPCSQWGRHGFPSHPGQGWLGDTRHWVLDVGALGAQVYLGGKEPHPVDKNAVSTSRRVTALPKGYPGVNRSWISFEIGPEQMSAASSPDGSLVLWEVEGWDVQVPVDA